MRKVKELLQRIEYEQGLKIVYLEYFSDGSWTVFDIKSNTLCEGGCDSDIEQELEKYLESCKE